MALKVTHGGFHRCLLTGEGALIPLDGDFDGIAVATDEACRFGVINCPLENPTPEAEKAFLEAEISKWTGLNDYSSDVCPLGRGAWAFEAYAPGFLNRVCAGRTLSRIFGAQSLAANRLAEKSRTSKQGLVALLAGRRSSHLFTLSRGRLISYLFSPPAIASPEAVKRAMALSSSEGVPTVLLLASDAGGDCLPDGPLDTGESMNPAAGGPENTGRARPRVTVENLKSAEQGDFGPADSCRSLEQVAFEWLKTPGPGDLELNAFDRRTEVCSPGPWRSKRVLAALVTAMLLTILNFAGIFHEVRIRTNHHDAMETRNDGGLRNEGGPRNDGGPSVAQTREQPLHRGFLMACLRGLAAGLPPGIGICEASLERASVPTASLTGWALRDKAELAGDTLAKTGWTVGSLRLGDRGVWLFSAFIRGSNGHGEVGR